MNAERFATRSPSGLHTWSASTAKSAIIQHDDDVADPAFQVWVIVDSHTCDPGREYVVQLVADHWDQVEAPPCWVGVRDGNGRWILRDLQTGVAVDRTYADDEVVVRPSADPIRRLAAPVLRAAG